MKRSTNRILTTHVGSLTRPDDLLELYRTDALTAVLEPRLKSAVAEVVRQQAEAGIDVVNDGEFGKPMRQAVDFGAWGQYMYNRVSGFETRPASATLTGFGRGKDRADFKEFYAQYTEVRGQPMQRVCIGPITYDDTEVKRDIEDLKQALQGVQVEEAFLPVAWPNAILDEAAPNEYYRSNEEFSEALADAMKQEYDTIARAGFLLQIDDPGTPAIYDWAFAANRSMAEYRKWAAARIELLNYALRDIPEEQIRYHICWGSWHGPHSTDLPLKDYIDIMLTVRATGFAVEAGNVRHEHEWKVWRDAKVPEGKVVVPGVVSHATNVLEHPEVIADRIVRYANVVGRENVMAGTDCGLGGRIHPQLAWAKLRALAEGARLASQQLWS